MIENHVHLKPGSLTDVVITRSFKHYMEKPYSECDIPNDRPKNFDSKIYKLFAQTEFQYSQQACFEQCYQQRLLSTCNCIDSSVLSLFTNISECFTDKELKCKNLIFPNEIISADFIRDTCLPQCPLECNQTKFGVATSTNNIIGAYHAKIINENKHLSEQFENRQIGKEEAQSSFVQAAMFYESLSYGLETESPKMNFVSLLASVGGNLSLLLGISLFSFFEVIDVLMEICFIYYEKKCNLNVN